MSHDYTAHRDVKPNDNILAQISATALKQKEAEALVEKLTEDLRLAKEALTRIAEFELPNLMDAAEQEEVKTKDGIKVKVSTKIRGSIPKGGEDAAFKWLEDNEHEDLIKRLITVEFGKEDEAWAKKFMTDLKKRKRVPKHNVKLSVHPATLASFVAEQLEAGEPIPMETLGVYRQRVAKIEVTE